MRAKALAFLTLSVSPAVALDDLPRGLASVVAARQAHALPTTGTIVPPYPDGLTSLGGACAGPPASAEECALVVGTLDPEGGGAPVAIYSGRPAGEDEKGRPLWTVIDVIAIPVTSDDRFVNYSTCRTDLSGLHPVAVMRSGSGQMTTESTPWITALHRNSGRFVEIVHTAVTCENLLP